MAVGLAILVVASDRVVVAAVRISVRLGISAILIGALIVGLGTSIPELLVSAIAASDGKLDVAVANVVGSNAANLTLVLGAAAAFAAIRVGNKMLLREAPLMAVAVGGLAVIVADREVTRIEATVLLVGLVVALVLLVVWSRHNPPDVEEEAPAETSLGVEFLYGTLAIVATVAGAKLLLDGAIDVGERLNWSATFLGLLLGVGTSLPELATAAAAARRRESDLVLGNVIGSNIFNSLAVAGVAGLIGPGRLNDFDPVAMWGMLGAVALSIVAMATHRKIGRIEGLLLLGAFFGFALLTL